MKNILAGGLLTLALSGPAFAGPMIVDGNVSDWGITVADNNGSNFTNPQVSLPAILLGFMREDQNDLAGDGGFLGPHRGGQNYDGEFMAVALAGDRLHVVIVTGQRPDNGLARFSPGDIRIVADTGLVYGIEVGGGVGGGAGGSLLGGAIGSTYTLNGSGYTQSHSNSARTTGSIWLAPNWLNDAIEHNVPVQLANDGSGIFVGNAEFVYTRDTFTSQHAVIELSLDRAIFGGATMLDFFWSPSCNNDVLIVHDDLPGRVPEPGALALLGLGFLGLTMTRRRR
jgi:hypothetical protein